MQSPTTLILGTGTGRITAAENPPFVQLEPTRPPGLAVTLSEADFAGDPRAAVAKFLAGLRSVFPPGRSEPLPEGGTLLHLASGRRLYAWPDALLLRDAGDNELDSSLLPEWAGDAAVGVSFVLTTIADSESSRSDASRAA